MIVVPHNYVLSVSEITLSYLIVAIYTAEDVFVQSISEWLSKMANGKSQMVNGKGGDVTANGGAYCTKLQLLLTFLQDFNLHLHTICCDNTICHLPFWTTILKSTVLHEYLYTS